MVQITWQGEEIISSTMSRSCGRNSFQPPMLSRLRFAAMSTNSRAPSLPTRKWLSESQQNTSYPAASAVCSELTKISGEKLSNSMTSKSKMSAYLESDPCSVSTATILPLGPASARASRSMVLLLPQPAGPMRATLPLAAYFTALRKLKHGDGTQTWYAHLSLIKVTVGQDVRRGEVIEQRACYCAALALRSPCRWGAARSLPLLIQARYRHPESRLE